MPITSKIIALLEIGCIFLLLSLSIYVTAQTHTTTMTVKTSGQQDFQDARDLSRLDTEVADLREQLSQHSAQMSAMNVEGRLSRLETTQDINQRLLLAIAGSLGLLLLEAAQRRFGKNRRGSHES